MSSGSIEGSPYTPDITEQTARNICFIPAAVGALVFASLNIQNPGNFSLRDVMIASATTVTFSICGLVLQTIDALSNSKLE